jgi:TRAP-type transport system periplasmic protein
MRFLQCGMRTVLAVGGTCALSIALNVGAAQAQTKTYVMKITTPTIHAALDQYGRNFAAAVEKDSGGRIKGQVFPASQLGSIPRQIEGTQFGSIQVAIIPPEFFVGVDQRFEVLAAPGLVGSMKQGQQVTADPQVLKLMLGLGANKGLHGIGLFMAEPAEVVSRTPIRTLADFKGKRLRIFASEFQSVAFQRLGVTPIAMSPADVLPAVQQGTLDGAVFGVQLLSGLHFYDTAKYVTMTHHSGIFAMVEVSKKWYDSLPPDLQKIIDRDGAQQVAAINPQSIQILDDARTAWTKGGGQMISLPPDDQAKMLQIMGSVGDDVAKTKPELKAAYDIVKEAAKQAK